MANIIRKRRTITNSSESSGEGTDPIDKIRITNLENNEFKIIYWTSISSDSGTITKPTNSTILLDSLQQGIDAVVETIIGGQPSGFSPITSGGTYVTVSSFDTDGNYTLSGIPSAYPVAIVYIIKIKALDYVNINNFFVIASEPINSELISNKDATNGYVGLTDLKINFKNLANTFTSFFTNSSTASRTYTFPDKDVTVAGINDVYFELTINNGVLNPTDNTVYYFGLTFLSPTTIATNHQFKIGYDVVIIGAIISASLNVIQGSSEDSVMKINNITQGSVSTIGFFKTNAIPNTSAVTTTITGLNIPVGANDFICGQWETPLYSINPTSVRPMLYLILKRA